MKRIPSGMYRFGNVDDFRCKYCAENSFQGRFFSGKDLIDHIKKEHPEEMIKRLDKYKDAGEAQ